MSKRYEELDSLRGIAALVVVLCHFLFAYSYIGEKLYSNKLAPVLSVFWNGHGAVILFFVLSGFVLSLAFFKKVKPKYAHYLLKRICRIYIPFIFVFFIALFLKVIFDERLGSIPEVVEWVRWDIEITLKSILDHLLFIGSYNHDAFVMVIWSLIHEMRISIVLPVIVLLLINIDWRLSLGIALILSFLSHTFMNIFPSDFNTPISSNFFITLHYSGMFIVGFLIAKYRVDIINKLTKGNHQVLMFTVGFLLLNFPKLPYSILAKVTGDLGYRPAIMLIDWISTLGAALIIIVALSSIKLIRLLSIKPIQFLGKVSYSLYLIHPVVILTLIYSLHGLLPEFFIIVMSFIVTIICSSLCYKYIEEPSIKLGRKLTSKMGNKKKVSINRKTAV